MSPTPDAEDQLYASADESYRAISGLAIVALLLGLASSLALAAKLLWFLPMLGVLVGSLALVHIRRAAEALSGRGMALAGLGLSVAFGSAAVAQLMYAEHLVAAQARQVADQWFAALAQDEPLVAHQFTLSPTMRSQARDKVQLEQYYRQIPDEHQDIKKFTTNPLVHTLLALNGKAHVKLYQTNLVELDQNNGTVLQTYAVTYDDAGTRKSLFVELGLTRIESPVTSQVDWRVVRYVGGVRPTGGSLE